VEPNTDEMVGTVAVLADDVRRRLYFIVREATQPVTRDEAASAAGISHKLAAFHLEKLVDAGLLRVVGTRPSGGVPRPGRSPKLYGRSDAQIALSIPPRHDDLMASILLTAIRLGGDPLAAAVRSAQERGREIGRTVRGVLRPGKLGRERALRLTMQALNQQGYEPEATLTPAQAEITLRNCPFHRLLTQDKRLVCTLNQSLIDGVLSGLDTDLLEAKLIPRETHCCVTVSTRLNGSGPPDEEPDAGG
jgi:predicted ArsR family transcriptional regulator